ncbi:UDP-3-O-acyl-N-acetylglucosamine deacetylase [Pontiella agarivorans]|uniref:UDP-3-O-acyl-N-acetylglucosamine deacetylase n=1 Tax=Pontiella agarivorans TaxID=3038953 RepID=A0ABU5N1X5_9BACT|nr:UDP-3-O-acyl-N-acetylglucosamine deacetylase [Pontiella agarivorans]MDZ8120449.1 UDP-3-O-acyl-N-acetylglucosamine deacetylase [Pontiella agarivorans]
MTESGTILMGDEEAIKASYAEMNAIPVDWDLSDKPVEPLRKTQTTLGGETTISGPGTFMGKAMRTITLAPSNLEGWWLDRADLPNSLPIRVGIANVWTTGQIVSNIVLRSGNPHNYVRMVEHLISLRMGMGIDNMVIKFDSGDPPLFEQGSLDVVEAIKSCGVENSEKPVNYFTVKKPITVGGTYGDFVTLAPPLNPDNPQLTIDAAINFNTALGQQRIIFPVCKELTEMASVARTNTSNAKVWYCRTIGKLFADVRNLGYNKKNVSIAGKKRYINEPRLVHEGKALEAVWHRSVLDLLAAIALIPNGQFVGHIKSYKAGHRLDCELMKQLYLNEMLVPLDEYLKGVE